MITRPRAQECPCAFSYERTGDRRWPDDPRKATARREGAPPPASAPGAVAAIQMSGYRVIVTEHRTRGLVDSNGTAYASPPQTGKQARSLIALLAGQVRTEPRLCASLSSVVRASSS